MKNQSLLVVAAVAYMSLACEEAKSETEMSRLIEEGNSDERTHANQAARSSTLKYDVSENMNRFVFDDAPVFEDGFPAYGNTFITQGYVYPGGFLDDHQGVKVDGAPAFPDDVIGTWTCRGFFVGDGAHTTSGAMVITTQHWDLFEEPGFEPDKKSAFLLTNEGYEGADPDASWKRPITGGTDEYSGATGQAIQTFVGINPSEGFDLRVRFEVLIAD